MPSNILSKQKFILNKWRCVPFNLANEMSNIIRIDDEKGVPHWYDFGTKNSSFLLTAQELKTLGRKNYYFMLEVKFPNLGVQDIDPHDPNISAEDIGRVVIECKNNPWYFFRECARVPVRGAGKFPLILTRASCAAVWCFMHSIDFMLCQPRQTHKTTWLTSIIEYEFIFEFQNVEIPYMHIRQDRCLENAEMLRDYICALPQYMNPWYGRTKLPGTKSLKYDEHNTSITILSQADSEVKAKDKMRGMTLFACFLDEYEYIPYISSVMEGATPAIISGREIMRKTGGRTCMMYASTPGDLETATGKAAQRMIDRTPPFSEQLYDFTEEELRNYFDGVTQPDENGNPMQITMLYIEFNYIQLRKDEAWLREQYNEAVRLDKMAEYRRGVLLQRFRGGSGAYFKQEDIEFIQKNYHEPDFDVFIMKKYHLYVYKHDIIVPDLNSETPYFDMSIPYLIGIDVATGKGGDNTAICITHPYTLQVVGELLSPYMGIFDLFRTITIIAKMLPRGVFCLESNYNGADVVDFVQETQLEHRFYHDPQIELTKNVLDKKVPEITLKHKANNKRHFGTYVSAKTREAMFNILKNILKDYRHLINTKYLVKDVCNLVVGKNGKIAADDGEHDDLVMAYLHTVYVLKYGYELNRFGIDKTLCTYDKSVQLIEEYEERVKEDNVDNSLPDDVSMPYEKQLYQDIASKIERDHVNTNGVDEYGYTRSQYNQTGGLNEVPTLHSTVDDLSFFREVNSYNF